MKIRTMLQGFEWYIPADGQHWNRIASEAERLAGLGFTDIWLPPAYKGLEGAKDVAMEMNSLSLMAFFLTVGFSFFGMNIMNIWPCIFGTWLFAKVPKVSFASQVNVAVFSTALSPFVSEAICRYPAFDGVAGAMVLKVLLGIALGAIAGFLMGILCQHSPNLHRGYTLSNAAAVAGFIGVLLFAFMYRGTGHEIPTNTDIGESYALLGNLFAVITSLLAVVCGFFMNGKSFRGMGEVLKSTGYKCDFTKNDGVFL